MSHLIPLAALHNAHAVLWLIVLIVGVLCLVGAAWRAYLRDFPAAAGLLIVGLVLVFIST